MEREKGFESQIPPVFSRLKTTIEGDIPGSTHDANASASSPSWIDEGDIREPGSPLPAPTGELFISAGALLADRAARDRAAKFRVEEILRRAVDQAAALGGEAP
jgi:hypothetical protein